MNVNKISALVSYSDEFLIQLRASIESFIEDHLHLQAWSVNSLGELQFNVSSFKKTNVGNNLLARTWRSTKIIGGDIATRKQDPFWHFFTRRNERCHPTSFPCDCPYAAAIATTRMQSWYFRLAQQVRYESVFGVSWRNALRTR